MTETLGLWLLTAHLIADFPLQADWMATRKLDSPLVRATHVYVHVWATAMFLLWTQPLPILCAVLGWIAVSHYVIDSRRWVDPKPGWANDGKLWVWLNDQILHLVSLSFVPAVIDVAHLIL